MISKIRFTPASVEELAPSVHVLCVFKMRSPLWTEDKKYNRYVFYMATQEEVLGLPDTGDADQDAVEAIKRRLKPDPNAKFSITEMSIINQLAKSEAAEREEAPLKKRRRGRPARAKQPERRDVENEMGYCDLLGAPGLALARVMLYACAVAHQNYDNDFQINFVTPKSYDEFKYALKNYPNSVIGELLEALETQHNCGHIFRSFQVPKVQKFVEDTLKEQRPDLDVKAYFFPAPSPRCVKCTDCTECEVECEVMENLYNFDRAESEVKTTQKLFTCDKCMACKFCESYRDKKYGGQNSSKSGLVATTETYDPSKFKLVPIKKNGWGKN